jgi:hypothetical protein
MRYVRVRREARRAHATNFFSTHLKLLTSKSNPPHRPISAYPAQGNRVWLSGKDFYFLLFLCGKPPTVEVKCTGTGLCVYIL